MFWERFYALCLANGKKPLQIVKELSIASGIITKWKKGTIPNGETLIKLSEYLECSVDYLLGRTDEPTSDTYLNSKEKKLIAAYRNKPDMQKSVDVLLGVTEGEFKGEIIGGQGRTNVAKIAAFGGGISTIPINENELDNEELDRLIEEAKFKIDEE